MPNAIAAHVLLLLPLALAAQRAQAGWIPVGQKQGVQVYRRVSPVIELAARGVIEAPPDRVLRVLLDYAHHPRYFETIAETRVAWTGPRSLRVYEPLCLKVISDRAHGLDVRWGRRGDALWMRYVCPPARPARFGGTC